ncbi:MAG TPA: maleylacetoacetate isomerase [Polyangiaceae bacterium]
MKLWSYWRSSSAYRVRIALGLKGLSYEYVAVQLRAGGEQHQGAFAGINPMRQVPALEVGEAGQAAVLVQSMAIIEYLDERFPEPPLLPGSALDRAHVRALAELVNSGIQPLQNLDVLNELEKGGLERQAWSRHFIARGLAALELSARDRAGAFLVGDAPTLADVYLVPQLYNARRFALALDAYPTLTRADDSARALPAFQAALPERQPDAEHSAPP